MVVWDGCSGSRLALAWKARVPGGPLDRALRRHPGRAERLGIRANRQDRRHLAPGVAVGIKVRDGQATVRIPSLGAASEATVIVSSLSRAAGPFPITIEAHDVAEPAFPDRVEEGRFARGHWRRFRPRRCGKHRGVSLRRTVTST